MNTEHRQYIVTLRWPSARPVPKYGKFTWNANLHRLVWRNEIAETMGQLAELVNQAVMFVKDQRNDMLFLEVVPVPVQEIPKEEEAAIVEDGPASDTDALQGEGEGEAEAVAEEPDAAGTAASTGKSELAEKMEMAGLPRKQT